MDNSGNHENPSGGSEFELTEPRLAETGSLKPPSTAASVSVICGIVACAFNLFVITSVLGFIFGLIALVSGLIALIGSRQGQAGLVLTGISFFILLIWFSSIVLPFVLDPTLTLDRPKL